MQIEERPPDGRERVRVWCEGRERYVYLYRLAAVAWGLLGGLGDDRVVHHEVPESWLGDEPVPAADGTPWLDAEPCLRAVEPGEHPRNGSGWCR